jgi:DegV family protein with EDD domain
LAQFIYGLAAELENEVRITARRFAEAARAATERCYLALSKPKEGTILTLLRDWSDSAQKIARSSDDFLVMLKGAFEEARASLARTRDLLPELKKAGVVDAGAAGLFHLLEGVMNFIQHGKLRELRSRSDEHGIPSILGNQYTGGEFGTEGEGAAINEALVGFETEPSVFRFCTECLVRGRDIDLAALRCSLEALGDSLVVAGSPTRARIHIHSDRPSAIFRLVEAVGEVEGHKVDDMELQRRVSAGSRRRCALLIDSACDLPDEIRLELGIAMVPVLVDIEGKQRLDREGITTEDFLEALRARPNMRASTSQPSPASFKRKMDLLLGHADEIVYLGLSSGLSGTFEAGRLAAARAPEAHRIRTIDSRSISVGAALLARRLGEAAAAGADADDLVALAGKLIDRVRFYVTTPDLSGLLRSGRLVGVKGLAARYLGVRPLIGIDGEGRASMKGVYVGAKKGSPALLNRVRRELPKGVGLEAIIAHVDASEAAQSLAARLGEVFPLERKILITPASPALALHGGPGALVLAFFGGE